jgi:hypothetical protein
MAAGKMTYQGTNWSSQRQGSATPRPADIGLALAADVEQAAMKSDGDRKSGEDEVGGVVQGEADALAVAEGALDQKDPPAAGFHPTASTTSPATRRRRSD